MIYIDSNVFLYAMLNRDRIGNRARALLGEVQQGKKHACSSVLTFDEIVWSVLRHRGREEAVTAGEGFLNFPNLKLIPADGDLAAKALEIIKKHGLGPRDAIHAASAISESVEAIISSDPHLDKIADLRRKPI